jgi:hypothetical protein
MFDSRKALVIGRTVIVLMLMAQPASADVAAARRIVMRDNDLISPSALTMGRNDVLEFENDSGQLLRLVFIEPHDQTDKIRCYPIDHTIARPDQMPWMLFDWGPGRQLTATIPPGKFASACSLVPGQYAFIATRVSRDPRGAASSLGTKGTITVQ